MNPTDSPKRKRSHLHQEVSKWGTKEDAGFSSSRATATTPVVKPAFNKIGGPGPFHHTLVHKPSKSPYSHIGGSGWKIGSGLHNMSTASTAKTSNMDTSFSESFVSSVGGGSSKSAGVAHDRMSDFCNYSPAGQSSPPCDYEDGVVGLSALKGGIGEFAGHKDAAAGAASGASASARELADEESDSDQLLIGHDDSFISSISATSNSPSFLLKDDHEHELAHDFEHDDEQQDGDHQHQHHQLLSSTKVVLRNDSLLGHRGPAMRLFQATPPPSPVPASASAPAAAQYRCLGALRTPRAAVAAAGSFATSSYNNSARPVIRSEPQCAAARHFDDASTLATEGDGEEEVDEHTRRLEESSSSSHNLHDHDHSDEEFCEGLGNGYGSYFMSEDNNEGEEGSTLHYDGDERDCPAAATVHTGTSSTRSALPGSMHRLQFFSSSSDKGQGAASPCGDAWWEQRDAALWASKTSSPLSVQSTASSTPCRRRKRGEQGQGEASGLQEPEAAAWRDCSRKQRRQSCGDSGHSQTKSGMHMAAGPGVFNSPNKKSNSQYIFIGNDSFDGDDDVDKRGSGTGDESDTSILERFPALLTSAKSSLPPLPTTPFRRQAHERVKAAAAPHTISHPPRDRDRDNMRDKEKETNRSGWARTQVWPQRQGGGRAGLFGGDDDDDDDEGERCATRFPYQSAFSVTASASAPPTPSSSGRPGRVSSGQETARTVAGAPTATPPPPISHGGAGSVGAREAASDLNNSWTSSSSSSSRSRPMPDQDAFERDTTTSASAFSSPLAVSGGRRRDEDASRGATQTCPPAPQRTSVWMHIDDNHSDFYDQSGVNAFLDGAQQQQQQQEKSAGDGAGPHDSPHCDEEGEVDDFNLFRPSFNFSQDREVGSEPIRRQNSLVVNKILASSTVPRSFGDEEKFQGRAGASADPAYTDILFDRDFVYKGIIGSGTFAEVYKCTLRNGSHESFAIKKSRRQFRSKRDRADLLSEVHIMQIVGATECPYLIQFYRAWQEDCYFYVQIELAERGTLRDVMNATSHAKQMVRDSTVVRVLHDVASGLAHIHQCGVVHLDIKPQNILIALDGTVKIGDFGIAMAQGTDEDEGHEGDTRYLPAEMLNSADRHYSADVFSLGLTLYEMCHVPDLDVLPYSGELWHDLREGRAPPLSSCRSEDLVRVISAAMASNPANRPSATDLLNSSCMSSVDFSVPCAELLVAELLLPSPSLSRSDSFSPMFNSSGARDGFGSALTSPRSSETTPSGAAYRHFVSPPPGGPRKGGWSSPVPPHKVASCPASDVMDHCHSAPRCDTPDAPDSNRGFHLSSRGRASATSSGHQQPGLTDSSAHRAAPPTPFPARHRPPPPSPTRQEVPPTAVKKKHPPC